MGAALKIKVRLSNGIDKALVLRGMRKKTSSVECIARLDLENCLSRIPQRIVKRLGLHVEKRPWGESAAMPLMIEWRGRSTTGEATIGGRAMVIGSTAWTLLQPVMKIRLPFKLKKATYMEEQPQGELSKSMACKKRWSKAF